jgi:hypothetical protein
MLFIDGTLTCPPLPEKMGCSDAYTTLYLLRAGIFLITIKIPVQDQTSCDSAMWAWIVL